MINEHETINEDFAEIDNAENIKIKDICERIEILLDSYCNDNGFDDLQSITQQQFAGGLMFVRFNLFDLDKSLLYKYLPNGITNGLQTLMYNDSVVLGVCQFYIYLCTKYNKIPKPIDFSYLTGIDLDTLKRWEGMESQRPQAYGTIKTLRKAYETGLENGAQSGKNPVGFIATLNHRFGWSSESKTSINVNITRSNEQLMSTYDDSLLIESDKKTP